MRLLDLILKYDSKKIYEPNLNYELFSPCSSELCKKLLELIKYNTKIYFEELVVFLFEYPDAFKIIHQYYPYNNNELKTGELKYANYYIYYWHNLYNKKYNFSVRIKNQRYDIIFPDEDQDNKVNPYFILNEKNSLLLSKGSFLKEITKNFNTNEYKQNIKYFDEEPSEKTTKDMFDWIAINFNGLYKESPLKTDEEINNLIFETSNFFASHNTLVSRIWSILINLSDKFADVIKYMKNACCFLEKDTLSIFEVLFNGLDKDNLEIIIYNINDISFFCESQ